MGCGASKSEDDEAPAEIPRGGLSASDPSQARKISEDDLLVHHQGLRRLRELDGATKIPFILVELVGVSNNHGFIEVCGKDEYGVYFQLEEWLLTNMRCTKLDAGDLSDHTPMPFCDALYRWEGFMVQAEDGTNNMGLATMRLVEFMCRKLCWTLGVINGGNVGRAGEIREQQVIFKAPHPMNLEAEHIMIELRSAGFIEVSGSSREAKDSLADYFIDKFKAEPCNGHQDWSDRYYRCAGGIFKERGKSGENNLGKLTVQVCDDVVNLLKGWTLVTMNGGNYGEGGSHREQQLVFRYDNHPLAEQPHFMIELREAGFIEVCGQDYGGMISKLADWLKDNWSSGVTMSLPGQESFCDKKFNWKKKDMMLASAELTEFFHAEGWQMVVCSQGTVAVKGHAQSREQQIVFRPGASGRGVVEPHLFIELYTGEGDPNLVSQPEHTQIPHNQVIRIREVGNCHKAVAELTRFITDYLGGTAKSESEDWKEFSVEVFLTRGLHDNNLGCWTMRMCDFMVDRLGWSFVVCNVCNLGDLGMHREQQLVFRFDGERREIPAVKDDNTKLDEVKFVGLEFPDYWKQKKVLALKQTFAIVSCSKAEVGALQAMFDSTFKRVLTRDRVYEYQLNVNEEMPYRLEVVHAFRCEHAELYRKFAERRKEYSGGAQWGSAAPPKTLETRGIGHKLNDRLAPGEAFLAHGTNPSSAMGILKTGFSLSAAGKATGTMFGYGIYLAECVSKCDEYARDDNGGTYPQLMALLLCRCLVGKPYVTEEAGEHINTAKSQGCDCVIGDREKKVGTYREFIFFDQRQVLPEYAVIYKREYDQMKVPEHMRLGTRGTTGRNWQLKTQKGWVDLAPDVSFELTQARDEGHQKHTRIINDAAYEFDFQTMQQQNVESGTQRQIRPPMKR